MHNACMDINSYPDPAGPSNTCWASAMFRSVCTPLRILAFVALAGIGPLATASDASVEIAKFFDASGRAVYTMKSTIPALKAQQPGLAAAIEGSLTYFDGDVYDKLMAQVLDRELSKDDFERFQAFMSTSSGQRVREVFHSVKEPSDCGQALSKFPAKDRRDADSFFSSTAAARALAAIESDGARALRRQYGEELMCLHLSKSDQLALSRLKQVGKCSPSPASADARLK